MNRRSIRFRLTAWYSFILAVTFVIVGAGVWLALQDSINDTADGELRARMRGMRVYLDRESQEGKLAEELSEDAALAPAGTRFRVADTSGRWLYQSPGTEGWGAAPDATGLGKRGISRTVDDGRGPVRVLTGAAGPGLIQIGMPMDEFSEMLDGFLWTALLATPALLLLAAAAGYWMGRRALAPVDLITRAAEEIEAKDLSQRLPVRGTGDELDQLSGKLNGMFARLESSFRRITQFTADASHELRTPVSIIRTTAEVTLTRQRSSEEYARAMERILSESERTTALIDNLMLLARADTRDGVLPAESVDLTEIVQSACADVGPLAEGKGVSLKMSGMPARIVRGDYEALRRLTLILIDNAIKYSHAGGEVELCVGAEVSVKPGMSLLEVKDHGIGIAAEDLPHIFERFYRASKDRSRRVDGFGLGLPIAQAIAIRHGGSIEVESREGAGAAFRVWIPAG